MPDIAREISTDAYSHVEIFDENIRHEQIGNTVYMMANPSETHEAIITEIIRQLGNYFYDKSCKVYGSNLGLDLKDFIPVLKDCVCFRKFFKKKLDEGKKDQLYLLPDTQIICDIDKSKFGPHGYRNVPKMIIEVFSPSTGGKDFSIKKDLYECIGVEEYWIVLDPQNVVVFALKDGKYEIEEYSTNEDILEIPISVFSDISIFLDRKRFEI